MVQKNERNGREDSFVTRDSILRKKVRHGDERKEEVKIGGLGLGEVASTVVTGIAEGV
jgi:hypothetical protein